MVTTYKATSPSSSFKNWWSKIVGQLGRIGKALMFPIATLPIAAILLRIGAQIPTGTPWAAFVQGIIINGGSVVFDNLPIIFGIGVAFGLSKDNRGEAALAGFIGMSLLTLLMKKSGADLVGKIYANSSVDFGSIFGGKYDAVLAGNVLNGIVAGALVAYIYNKFNGTELPTVLGFFSGRRLIPVLSVLGIMVFAIAYAVIFPWIGWTIFKFSSALADATGNRYSNAGIMFGYGFINRLLIPFGLHHIPNTLFWFQLGEHVDSMGNVVNGDIFIFLNGVPEANNAGTFQSGFFPIMMFGLPALAGTFYVTAENKEQKKRVLAMFGSAALVSFLTGITEPLEFAFLFAAPTLFFTHAFLTGLFGFIVGLFGIQIGFGFSAGLLDYLLSIPKSMDIIRANKSGFDAVMANPAWLWPIGIGAAATYFFTGKIIINKLDLATPGRKGGVLLDDSSNVEEVKIEGFSAKAKKIVKGLGGWSNIQNYQNCATRLRYDLVDAGRIDEKLLKEGGAVGVMKVSQTHVQVIIGPKVELLNNEIIANKDKPLD